MSSLKFALSVPVAAGLVLGAAACGSGNPTVKASRSAAAAASAAAEKAKNVVSEAPSAIQSMVPTAVPTPTASAAPAATKKPAANTVKWGSACKTTGAKSQTQYGTKVTCKWYQGKRVWR